MMQIKKFLRFTSIYGFERALIKSLGRLEIKIPLWIILSRNIFVKKRFSVGIIGCGQFSFSTIAYFLKINSPAKIDWCYDIDHSASRKLSYTYNIKKVFTDEISYDNTDIVYIASNHYSHTPQAIECMKNNCDVYIEKPMATNWDQLAELKKAKELYKKKIYVGYNRPFSPGILEIKKIFKLNESAFTFSCFVIGHKLSDDHWYRDPQEGTRISGNLAHWIDLSVNILNWRMKTIKYLDIQIIYSNEKQLDENIVVSFVSDMKDVINIIFTTRTEPFEGVSETLNFQSQNLIAKLHDHRKTEIWENHKKRTINHKPKNVGHKSAIYQPFNIKSTRDWNELIISTKLMLTISDMVKSKRDKDRFIFE